MSIETTKYGTWRVRYYDTHGRQRAKSFKRKIDAQRFEREVRTDLHRGDYVDQRNATLTVAQVADDWMSNARKLGAGGKDTYERDLKKYVLPTLGSKILVRLRSQEIDDWLTHELAEKPDGLGLAASTVHRHYRTLNRLCNYAIERGALKTNPCKPVEPPTPSTAEMRFLTAEQVEALADAIGDRYRAWVYTAVYAGLRWSETVGLRRGNVNGQRLAVVEQLVKRADGKWHADPPKTKAGRRVVALPSFLAVELADHIDRYAVEGVDGLVFPNREGRPLSGPSFTGNVYKPALERAGLDRDTRIHDLRHTAVALAIKAGAHPKAIQVRMGHASIAVTMDRYGHLFPEQDEAIAAALEGLRPPT